MEDAVLVLLLLLALILASFMLDRFACMVVSQSGFALVFGLLVGLLLVACGHRQTLHEHLNLSNGLFFDVLLPPIIYEGGFSIKRQAFFRNFPAVMSTSVLGTAIATAITASAVYIAGRFDVVTSVSWIEAALFGALISAIDPVATLACFNKLDAPPLLFNLVFGESVMNDAVAIALYQTLAAWEPGVAFSFQELVRVAANTCGMFVCSLLVSVAITLLGAFLLKRQVFEPLHHFPSYEISLCVIFSLLTYFVADSLHLSGIVALFFSGTMTAHYHFHTLSSEAQHAFTHLLHILAFISETLVYLFMGTSVVMLFAGRVSQSDGAALTVDDIDAKFIVVTILACLVARFFNTFPLLGMSNCFRSATDKISGKMMTLIWFAGLRGSIAFALAKNWKCVDSNGKSHKRLIESTTLMVVLITTIVIGGLTGPLLSALGLANQSKGRHATETDSDAEALHAESNETHPQSHHLRSRGSMHYCVTQPSSSGRTSVTRTPNRGGRADDDESAPTFFTPRPQFQDIEDDNGNEEVDRAHPAAAVTSPSLAFLRRPTFMGTLIRRWQMFDASYMQPAFGGENTSAHDHRPLSPVEACTLAKLSNQHQAV